jgi:hypothetical protein
LIYDLEEHRVEIVFCSPHLESVYAEMPDVADSGKLKVRIERITNDSIVPGPRVTRFPPPQESIG